MSSIFRNLVRRADILLHSGVCLAQPLIVEDPTAASGAGIHTAEDWIRLVFVDAKSGQNMSMAGLLSRAVDASFNYTRHAQFADDGSALIVDSHIGRVFAMDAGGSLLWELKHVPDSLLPHLAAPRWAMLVHPNDLVVGDDFNHRIVHLRRHDESVTSVTA